MRKFCDIPVSKIMGIFDEMTYHIPHDHDHKAGDHLRDHSSHCMALAIRAAYLLGIEDEGMLAAIAVGIKLHDIGKRWVNPSIIAKETEPTDQEFDTIRQHVRWRIVYNEIEEVFGTCVLSVPQYVIDCATGHQQKTKTEGYPSSREQTFKRYDLLDLMRFIDEFQAGFCKERTYRKAKSYEEMEVDLKSRAERGLLNKRIVELFFDSPLKDTFHDPYLRPTIKRDIIDHVGKINKETYDRLLTFKIAAE